MMADDMALLDHGVLDRLADDVGPDVVPVLVASLKREMAAAAEALPGHLAAGDLNQLEIGAHALKSAARSFGAMRLGEACLALELAAKAGESAEALGALMDDFLRLVAETQAAFEAL